MVLCFVDCQDFDDGEEVDTEFEDRGADAKEEESAFEKKVNSRLLGIRS